MIELKINPTLMNNHNASYMISDVNTRVNSKHCLLKRNMQTVKETRFDSPNIDCRILRIGGNNSSSNSSI